MQPMSIAPIANSIINPIPMAAFACIRINEEYASWSTKYSVAMSIEWRGRDPFIGRTISRNGHIGKEIRPNKQQMLSANNVWKGGYTGHCLIYISAYIHKVLMKCKKKRTCHITCNTDRITFRVASVLLYDSNFVLVLQLVAGVLKLFQYTFYLSHE